MSRPAVPLRSDPASAGVTPPAGAHNGAEGPVAFRALLHPLADPEVREHLAWLRATEPVWPPAVCAHFPVAPVASR